MDKPLKLDYEKLVSNIRLLMKKTESQGDVLQDAVRVTLNIPSLVLTPVQRNEIKQIAYPILYGSSLAFKRYFQLR
jgi:uncharacterized protein Yka (UPF0111/DUF47 family)